MIIMVIIVLIILIRRFIVMLNIIHAVCLEHDADEETANPQYGFEENCCQHALREIIS